MLHFIFLLIIIVAYMQNLKKSMPAKLLLAQNWDKIGPFSQTNNRDLLEISYIPLLSIMIHHYHRLYQISSLEVNLSLGDRKQLFRQKLLHRGIPTRKLIIVIFIQTILNMPSYILQYL